jgi:hypothetical protein
MTEQEWLACTDPTAMLDVLRKKRKASQRKLRLFAVACWRRAWSYFVPQEGREVFPEAAEIAEKFADGQATAADRRAAYKAADAVLDTDYLEDYAAVMTALHSAWKAADQAALLSREFFGKLASDKAWSEGASDQAQWLQRVQARAEEAREQARLLHDIVNNPVRSSARLAPAVLAWNGGTVRRLARTIYEERRPWPAVTLDPACLAVLADALEEAGCHDPDILDHFRRPGEHVRGCHVLDLLLDRK